MPYQPTVHWRPSAVWPGRPSMNRQESSREASCVQLLMPLNFQCNQSHSTSHILLTQGSSSLIKLTIKSLWTAESSAILLLSLAWVLPLFLTFKYHSAWHLLRFGSTIIYSSSSSIFMKNGCSITALFQYASAVLTVSVTTSGFAWMAWVLAWGGQ